MNSSTESQPFDLTDYYDFDLPKALIAQQPLANREDARLMVVKKGAQTIDHCHIRNLHELLDPGDCLVLNDTRVLPAKLVGFRSSTGGRWQGLFLQADQQGNWKVLCKTRGNAKPGETVMLQDRDGLERITLDLITRLDDGSWVVRPRSDLNFETILREIGRVPLPNYIRNGQMVESDVKNYQTIFGKHAGSVAAPTAGLHMTKELLRRLIDRGINIASVTLHVGIGTFKPVATERLDEHVMHFERGNLEEKSVSKIREARESGKRVVAVGTTCVRILETASQAGPLCPWTGETNLFIRPPYRFGTVNAMLTNFHLPRSTLLVLVRTFGGDELIQRAYAEAIDEKYRFYSYGDAMLILD
jgi:S-adenosylmethionine:tRNA ribosyltransferase-isomerase